MSNFFSNKYKIGILGDANCGKTVFLTSLLWNLEAAQLYLGKKHEVPTDIKIHTLTSLPSSFCFGYEENVRSFKDHKKWPAKTTSEYALARCSYKLPKHLPYEITFVDIPGDRMADMLIWQHSSYADWSAATLKSWQRSSQLSQYFRAYNDSIQHPTTFDQLTWNFKCGMRSMFENYIPQISPSTLFFADGKGVTLEQLSDDFFLRQRPIWKDGDTQRDFIPLPMEWKKATESQIKYYSYAECEQSYKLYRKKVVNPLFSQISSCDSFIYCIDILGILAACPEAFHKTQEEIQSFMDKVMPGLFWKLLNLIGKNPMRIAFVATKSDKVYGANLSHLKNLLKDIVLPYRKSQIQDAYFTCTAWNSTREKNGYATCRVMINHTITPAIIQVPELPDTFNNDWNGEKYQYLETEILPSPVAAKPPLQTGIDSILNYVIDGIL